MRSCIPSHIISEHASFKGFGKLLSHVVEGNAPLTKKSHMTSSQRPQSIYMYVCIYIKFRSNSQFLHLTMLFSCALLWLSIREKAIAFHVSQDIGFTLINTKTQATKEPVAKTWFLTIPYQKQRCLWSSRRLPSLQHQQDHCKIKKCIGNETLTRLATLFCLKTLSGGWGG